MTLGEFVQERRKLLGLSRNMLATRIGISHTEIHRIENGERKQPSLKVLTALAVELQVQPEKMMEYAGYKQSEDAPTISTLYPSIKTDKQKETIEKIIDGLSRNSDLNDESLDDLYKQVEMFFAYEKSKKKDS